MRAPSHTLLPSGFADLLPPDAVRQRQFLNRMLDQFQAFGYEEVSPPLMEFESSLLADAANSLDRLTFRLFDPHSHQMMGIRADMTLQVARIAASRMAMHPLPLRLSYGGICLLVSGTGLRKERQILQVGAELIGIDTVEADAEIIRMATNALADAGFTGLSVDLTLPGFTELLLRDVAPEWRDTARDALREKDRSTIARLDLPSAKGWLNLLELAGSDPAEPAWCEMISLLPAHAGEALISWLERVAALAPAGIQATLTLDPLEDQGLSYHGGLAFTLFSTDLDGEAGRGGRYLLDDAIPAVGVTLYVNPLLRGMAQNAAPRRCFVPAGSDESVCKSLRDNGWQTLYDIAEPIESSAETLGCTHRLENGTPMPIKGA